MREDIVAAQYSPIMTDRITRAKRGDFQKNCRPNPMILGQPGDTCPKDLRQAEPIKLHQSRWKWLLPASPISTDNMLKRMIPHRRRRSLDLLSIRDVGSADLDIAEYPPEPIPMTRMSSPRTWSRYYQTHTLLVL